jgi:dTDP-4-amino-4,6-dideoxygalactose transaminase
MLAQGPKVAELEAGFVRVTGAKHAIATSSGTTGLHLALLAHGIGPGDEVITSSFTFIASVNTILFTGARPVFVDIDEPTFNLDPARLEAAITPRTKAVMPVHLYGQACDMDEICAIARKHGLAVIEDAAQAVGATYGGRGVGSFGTGVFSLYATKNVMSGEGGIITTDDDRVADQCRLLRSHGMRERYQYEMLGYNFRLNDVLAAIGVAQLDRMAEATRRRRANARQWSRKAATTCGTSTPCACRMEWIGTMPCAVCTKRASALASSTPTASIVSRTSARPRVSSRCPRQIAWRRR